MHYTGYLETYIISGGYLSNFEMDSMYDWDGKKFYTGRPGSAEPIEALLGAQRVYVSMTELAPAVMGGQIDIFACPVTVMWSTGFYQLFHYLLLRPFYNTNMILFNQDVWEHFPVELQDLITYHIMPAVTQYTSDIVVEEHKVAVAGLKSKLTAIHVVTPAEEAQIWEQLQVYPAFVAKAASMDQTILARINELRPPASAGYDPDIIEILEYAGIPIPQ
jgi:TRAP-type C4-dicarboxylate transport system substrate-binding protein